MRYILTGITILFFGQTVNAQNISQYAERYRYYRERFNNYFVSVGPNPGQSLPAHKRSEEVCAHEINDKRLMLSFDDTPNHLGFYIGMLATEYRLYKDEGKDVSGIIKELYYALYAINRLDQTEAGIGNTALDGFYIREDVPANFVQLHPELNKNLPLLWDQQLVNVAEVNTFSNCNDTLGTCWKVRGLDCQAMSMDHNARILMGLALVKKFVDAGEHYNGLTFQDGNILIRKEAIDIAHRIIKYMQNGGWFLWMPTSYNHLTYNFLNGCLNPIHTFNPLNEPCVNCPIDNKNINELVPRGCFPGEYSYGIKKAGQFITNYNYQHTTPVSFWMLAYKNIPPMSLIYNSTGKLSQVLIYAAIGDSWSDPFGSTQQHMHHLDNANEKWRFYTLLHTALYGKTSILMPTDAKILSRLENAPCIGPNAMDSYWYELNMFFEKEFGSTQHYNQVAYNGLDYMLFYNLWYLNFRNVLPLYSAELLYYNLPNTNENLITHTSINLYSTQDDFPKFFNFNPWTDIGSNTHPVEVRALKTITAYNVLKQNSTVAYRAGEYIDLMPGFETEIGATFDAYLQPVFCSSPGNGNYLRTSDNSIVSYNIGNISSNYSYTSDEDSEYFYSQEDFNSIRLYPNPTDGNFILESDYDIPLLSIKMYDIFGKQVMPIIQKEGNYYLFYTSNFSRGLYLIKIGRLSRKIVIE